MLKTGNKKSLEILQQGRVLSEGRVLPSNSIILKGFRSTNLLTCHKVADTKTDDKMVKDLGSSAI